MPWEELWAATVTMASEQVPGRTSGGRTRCPTQRAGAGAQEQNKTRPSHPGLKLAVTGLLLVSASAGPGRCEHGPSLGEWTRPRGDGRAPGLTRLTRFFTLRLFFKKGKR